MNEENIYLSKIQTHRIYWEVAGVVGNMPVVMPGFAVERTVKILNEYASEYSDTGAVYWLKPVAQPKPAERALDLNGG